jgi:hypothetical protein
MLRVKCVSNQHTARYCNRTILRVDLTHIREDSTCIRAGSTRVRALLFVFFRCSFYFHLTTRLLIRYECTESARHVVNCTVLCIDSTKMRVKSTCKNLLNQQENCYCVLQVIYG